MCRSKVFRIERNDRRGLRIDRKLEDHIVLRVFRYRPPEIFNGAGRAHRTQMIQYVIDVLRRKPELPVYPFRYRFIFKNERNRQAEPESALTRQTEHFKRGPVL